MSQGPVVRKLVNANLELKFNPVSLILIEFTQQIPSDHLEAIKVKMEAKKDLQEFIWFCSVKQNSKLTLSLG